MNDTRMQAVVRDKDVSVYNLLSSSPFEILIANSADVSTLLSTPEICGSEFQSTFSNALETVMRSVLLHSSFRLAAATVGAPIDVLYVLRGGLNYKLHEVLTKVTFRYPEVSFLSSQRISTEDNFEVAESDYVKWSIQEDAVLCLGDICATGTTLTAALDRALARYALENKRPRWLLVVTVGTSYALHALSQYNPSPAAAKGWAGLEGVTLVFLGQIFHLYEGNSLLAFSHLPHTDFFRRDSPAAPEFEGQSLLNPVCNLERCAIYDGGSRAFEPRTYIGNLQRYWLAVRSHAHEISMEQLLSSKSSLLDYDLSYDDWLQRRPWWANVETLQLQSLHRAGAKALHALKAVGLAGICEERLAQIQKKERELDGQLH